MNPALRHLEGVCSGQWRNHGYLRQLLTYHANGRTVRVSVLHVAPWPEVRQ